MSSSKHFCLKHSTSNKSGSASVAGVLSYILKFQYLTDLLAKLRKKNYVNDPNIINNNNSLYQNYLDEENKNIKKESDNPINVNSNNVDRRSYKKVEKFEEDNEYFDFLERAIFGSPTTMESIHLNHLFVKKNNKGLVPKLLTCRDQKRPSEEILRHNLQKVLFYEQSPTCSRLEDVFVSL